MKTIPAGTMDDNRGVIEQLSERGYVVIENMLSEAELKQIRNVVEDLFAKERESPYDPGDGPVMDGDAAIESFPCGELFDQQS